MLTPSKLIIIGAGPKALAIAAKNTVLKSLHFSVPEIHIIEKNQVAGNWSGKWGFTDGIMQLGTPPEKDIGFPYESKIWGAKEVNRRMMAFSWNAYLQDTCQYACWIDQGRPRPTHYEWSKYLSWIHQKVKLCAFFHHGDVFKIQLQQDSWKVSFIDQKGCQRNLSGKGLVLTGPGKSRQPESISNHPCLLSYQSYWRQKDIFGVSPKKVAIIGNGESAASIATSLVGLNNESLEIEIISPSGALYSRGESSLENCFFSDPENYSWTNLSWEDRKKFISRTDTGVFSHQAMSDLSSNYQIKIVPGKVLDIFIKSEEKIVTQKIYNGQEQKSIYDAVIFSNGFDPFGFLMDLCDNSTKNTFAQQLSLESLTQEDFQKCIQTDLSLGGLSAKLFLPMLSSLAQGPGFSNLSSLGRVSDRVLSAFVKPVHLFKEKEGDIFNDNSINPPLYPRRWG